jgi:phosphatidylethanolamine/phosphatidyl-N-methylethanolamine N-methyltransferase
VSARQYWDRHAGRYDRATRWLSRPLPRMLDLTVDAVRGSARVLEVAAGTGLVTTAIGPHVGEVVATDYASAMVAQLQERIRAAGLANVRCDQADLYRMTRPPASFDAVIAANVLHLVPDLAGALASLRDQLRPGGVLVVPTYCHAETFRAAVLSRLLALTGFPGERRLTTAELVESVTAAGLEVTRTETIPGPIPIGYVEARLSS